MLFDLVTTIGLLQSKSPADLAQGAWSTGECMREKQVLTATKPICHSILYDMTNPLGLENKAKT